MRGSKREALCRAGGYVFAVAFIIAGWWVTALVLRSPALPTPCLLYTSDAADD